MFLDVCRGIAAGVGTIAIIRALPATPPIAGIAVCVALFGVLSAVVGLVTRADMTVITARFGGRRRLIPEMGRSPQ